MEVDLGNVLDTDLEVGAFVLATAGRDRGKCYIIYKVIDDNFVAVIDGKKRGLANPKKKNRKHLGLLCPMDEDLAVAIREGRNNLEAQVRAKIRRVGPLA